MATRGEIRQGVRYYLGELTPGLWQDEELNFYIQEACNEHAKRAYSLKTKIYTSTIIGVRDYAFPPNFGELLRIRYRDETISDEWGLDYIDKDVLRDWSYTGTENGDPYYYYREQDAFGLFPVPSKPLVIEYAFENDCPGFSKLWDRETEDFYLHEMCLDVQPEESIEPLEMEVRDTDLDPRCIWVSQVSIYLKREGSYYPGNIWVSFTNRSDPDGWVHVSGEIPANTINARPEWVHFDFTHNPIEVNSDEQRYLMQLHADEEYLNATPGNYGGTGIVIGTNPYELDGDIEELPFFQMHRLRNDLEIEYYRNVCDLLEHDGQELDIPDRYSETITKMVLEKANMKSRYDLQSAIFWGEKANEEIKKAKAQAMIPTLGKRRELRRSTPRMTNITYNNATGLFRLRLGRP